MMHKINKKFIKNIDKIVNNAAKQILDVAYIGDVYAFENEIDDFLLNEHTRNYNALAYITLNRNSDDIVKARKDEQNNRSEYFAVSSDDDLLPGDIVIRLYKLDSIEEAMDALLHELIHYLCAYRGYDCDDESSDFMKLCKQYGVADNYSNNKFVNKQWHKEINYDKMWEYYKALV